MQKIVVETDVFLVIQVYITLLKITYFTEDWIDLLSSEEHVEYMKMMNKAGTDEKYRQTDKFNEQYMGTPGTFRTLNVD